MATKTPPTYDLELIKRLLDDPDKRIITRECYKNAVGLGYASKQEIVNQVLKLKKTEFYKTMEAEKIKGLWQDVYRSHDGTYLIYIKLQISKIGKGVVIQFKEK